MIRKTEKHKRILEGKEPMPNMWVAYEKVDESSGVVGRITATPDDPDPDTDIVVRMLDSRGSWRQ